jgi:hypothetical protein
MALHVARLDPAEQHYTRTATVIGPGLVLLDVRTVAAYASSNDLHWRLADGKKPPLDIALDIAFDTAFDIALDADTGAFLRLAFFISHEEIPVVSATHTPPPIVQGGVLCDLSL